MKKYWMGSKPSNCDLCNYKFKSTFIDGRLKPGPWGMLCPSCHKEHGVGLGLGCGQKYKKESDTKWYKIAG